MGFYDKTVEGFSGTRLGSWMLLHVFTHVDPWLMRASGGRLSTAAGSRFHDSTLLLKTTGARSGQSREVPLVYLRRGSDYVVIASRTGHRHNPAWYHNLKHNPKASIYIGGREIAVTAREAEGAERDELYERAVELSSGFDIYRERTQRRIPVMILTPAGASA